MNIFVSYTTRDGHINREFLVGISDVVSDLGSSYIDLLDNHAVDKQAHVEAMLNESDVLLLLSSSSISDSQWVHWELTQAKKLKVPIIEICVKQKDVDEVGKKILSEFSLYAEANNKTQVTSTAHLTQALP